MKHLQHTSETAETLSTYVWNACKNLKDLKHLCSHFKYMQHPNLLVKHLDETLATSLWKHLKHTLCNMHSYAISRSIFATSTWNTSNICLKAHETYARNMKHTLAICVYSHYNICNIQMKHLKHTFETLETLEICHLIVGEHVCWQQGACGDLQISKPTSLIFRRYS
jgi:hypothetical protein